MHIVMRRDLCKFLTWHFLLTANIVINSSAIEEISIVDRGEWTKKKKKRSALGRCNVNEFFSMLCADNTSHAAFTFFTWGTAHEYILIHSRIAAFGVALPSRVSESSGNKECRVRIVSRQVKLSLSHFAS